MSETNDSKDLRNITDLSEMIEKLRENPEIVSNVASALGLGSIPPPDREESQSAAQLPQMLSAIAPLVTQGSGAGHDDQRLALLLALRPYLNHERQEIIDYIIKFSKIGDLLKKLK